MFQIMSNYVRAAQRSLDNNVDHRRARTESDIDSRGRALFTTVPICPSFHAGSLIVNRRDILIAYYFPLFYKRSNTSAGHRALFPMPINRVAILSRYISLHFSHSARFVGIYLRNTSFLIIRLIGKQKSLPIPVVLRQTLRFLSAKMLSPPREFRRSYESPQKTKSE